jgi:hypothetical protein
METALSKLTLMSQDGTRIPAARDNIVSQKEWSFLKVSVPCYDKTYVLMRRAIFLPLAWVRPHFLVPLSGSE